MSQQQIVNSQQDINHFTDLKAWQINHQASLEIYKITKRFPKEEIYSLTDQLRRATSSIGANIAEGWGRFHFADKNKFYYNARGSNCEVQNFLLLSKDLSYLSESEFKTINDKIFEGFKVLNGLIKSLDNLKRSF